MPYAQIEVSAPRHRKVGTLSDVAFRLWVTALCYCQEHLTDGVLHPEALRTLTPANIARPKVVGELVAHGLWKRNGTGWQVHDYLSWNESRERVEERRAKLRARQERWRNKTPVSASSNASPATSGDALVTEPLRNATLRNDPQTPTEARPSVLADDVWQLWRTVADEHGAPVRLGVSQTQTTHLVALAGAYSLDELGTALRAWWASPYVTGRNLGLFVSQLDEVLAHVASGSRTAFRQPPDKAPARAPAQVPYRSLADWVCPHTPHCAARRGCEQRQLLDAAKAKVPPCP